MKSFTIRPNSIGAEMTIEARSLAHVPEAFCKNIGLAVVKVEAKIDPAKVHYMEFTIGTGNSFVAWAVEDVANS